MARTVNEQTRGLYRLVGERAAGVAILIRVRRRLYGVEWPEYLKERRQSVVFVAVEHVQRCLMLIQEGEVRSLARQS